MPEARLRTRHAPTTAAPADGCHSAAEASAPSDQRGLRGLALGLVLGGVVAAAWLACGKTHARRRAHRSTAPPEPVQDWENEGGSPDACTG